MAKENGKNPEPHVVELLLKYLFEQVASYASLRDVQGYHELTAIGRVYLEMLAGRSEGLNRIDPAALKHAINQILIGLPTHQSETSLARREEVLEMGNLRISLGNTAELTILRGEEEMSVVQLAKLPTMVLTLLLKAAQHDRFVTKDEFIQALGYETYSDDDANNLLRQQIHTVRKRLNELVPTLGRVALLTRRSDGFKLDMDLFQEHVEQWLAAQPATVTGDLV